MKKLVIIFLTLTALTFVFYSVYNFVIEKIGSLGWFGEHMFHYSWSGISGGNFHGTTFKDTYSASNISSLNLDITGVDIDISSYDGNAVKYEVSITSNFKMKLIRKVSNGTLFLRTYPNPNDYRKIKEGGAELKIEVPKRMNSLKVDLTGGEIKIDSCNFNNGKFDLTGVLFESNASTIMNCYSDITGGEVKFDGFKSSDFSMDLTGGKSKIYFIGYNTIKFNVTGGSVKLYGLNKDINIRADVSMGSVDAFGEKHYSDFEKSGVNGDLSLDITAAKVDLYERQTF